MKIILLSVTFLFLLISPSFSQTYLAKQWDYSYGGNDYETFNSLMQTADGGFVVGGFSRSDNSGDVSEANKGIWDYWIVKTDLFGVKQWDRRFGGDQSEELFSLSQCADKGFILGGWSTSSNNGDVSGTSRGNSDFWIVKIDSSGAKEWDNRFGGAGVDWLTTICQASDGGFIMGGYTLSDSSVDISTHSLGSTDILVIKTDALGNKLWDKRYGGYGSDNISVILNMPDGGFMFGGSTSTDSSGDVSQHTHGSSDFWLIRTDSVGTILWNKVYGGNGGDGLKSVGFTSDGGYILGGSTFSDVSGDVSEPTRDTSSLPGNKGDFWILKIDSAGNKQWDHRFGGSWIEDGFGHISQTQDGGYLFGGASYSGASGDKSDNNIGGKQSWIIKTDSLGIKQWDKTIYTDGTDESGYAIQTTDGCYVIANYTFGDSSGYKTQASKGSYDYWLIKFCETTQPQYPVASFAPVTSSSCPGGCFDFTNLSFDAGSFRWYFPGASPPTSTAASPTNICYANSGQYSVTLIATNSSGNDTLTETNLITIFPPASVNISQNLDTLFAPQGFPSYQWYQGSTTLLNETNYFYVFTQDGSYSVLVLDSNGCPSMDSVYAVNVSVFDLASGRSVIRAFPNPTRDKISINLESTGGYFELTDVSGKLLLRKMITTLKSEIDMSSFESGLYFLTAWQNGRQLHGKIMKE
jgi:PKD repeat protein